MTAQMQPDRLFFGAPVSLTVGGEESGTSFDAPKVTIEYTTNADKATPQGARGKIKGLMFIKTAVMKAVFKVNEFSATKLGWVMPGATATSVASVGQVLAGLDTTLAADPILGATNIKLTSVTTVTVGQFVQIGPAPTVAATSEVVKVLTVGTTGSGGSGCDIENDAGGGLRIDHGNAEVVTTVSGTILAAPAAAGAINIKVDSVADRNIGDLMRIGYLGHYETRALTAVGTIGPSGTGLTFAIPLTRDHGLDEWVVEVTTLGTTTVQPVAGRIPSSAYKDVILTGVGLDGLPLIVELDDALSLVNQDIPFSDDDWSGFTVELEAYVDPATPTVIPWRIKIG